MQKIKLSENALVKHCLWRLKEKGYVAKKIKTHGVYNIRGKGFQRSDPDTWRGVSDILAFRNSTIYWFEVKAGSKPPLRDSQKEFQTHAHRPPYSIYAVIRKIEDLDEF